MTQILRQSTQVIVMVGPFVDVGDGFTPETGITLGAADEAELLKANTTTTTDISGATWAAISGCDGWYGLTLTTSHTDTVGPLTVMVNDDSVCLPVFARFQVIEEASYDTIYAASASPASTTNITAGTVTTATNVTTVNGLASGVITAAAIATGAIDADAVAADAVAEIQSGLATSAAISALNNLSQADVRTAVGLGSANLDTQLGVITTDTSTDIPATLSTIAGYLDTEVAAIKAKTDNLPAAPAAVGDIPTATENADALLNRDMSAVSDTNARSPLNALRFLRNKFSVAGNTLTVTKENDTTTAWSSTVTTDEAAAPITGSDPS